MGLFNDIGNWWDGVDLEKSTTDALGKPGMSQGLMALGSQLMAYGAPAIGPQGLAARNQHIANAFPAMQNAMMAQGKSERDAEMFKLKKEQLDRANKMAQMKMAMIQEYTQPPGAAPPGPQAALPGAMPPGPQAALPGAMPLPQPQATAGAGAAAVMPGQQGAPAPVLPLPHGVVSGPQDPNAAAALMGGPQQQTAGLTAQPRAPIQTPTPPQMPTEADWKKAAALEGATGIPVTKVLQAQADKAKAYKERTKSIGNGREQKEASHDFGRTWNPIGQPSFIRDPWVTSNTWNPDERVMETRSRHRDDLAAQRAAGDPIGKGKPDQSAISRAVDEIEEAKRKGQKGKAKFLQKKLDKDTQLSGEALKVKMLIDTGVRTMDQLWDGLMTTAPDGSVSMPYDKSTKMWANLPFTDEQALSNQFKEVVGVLLRLETGATKTVDEVADVAQLYMPKPYETETTRLDKMTRLKARWDAVREGKEKELGIGSPEADAKKALADKFGVILK